MLRTLRILLLLLLSSVSSLKAQVVAGFTASPLSGCAPLVVSFTNTTIPSSGTTYIWNFGNGSGPVTLTSPGTSYLAAGTYTVTLTATNGSSSGSFSRVITVYPSPVVSFTANDTDVCPGVPVTFTSSVTAGVPGPVSYLWSFGDGYTATTTPYAHAYSLPGDFNVSLSAANSAGCSTLVTRNTYIHVYTPPVASFTTSSTHACVGSGTVTFANSSTGTPPLTYKWIFGDGSPPSTSASPTHTYGAAGTYPVTLVTTDGHGCRDSLVVPNLIHVSRPHAAFTGPDSACLGVPVTFTNTSSSYISSYWTYGNGHSDTTTNGHQAYLSRGSFTVRLIVADSFCTDTFSRIFRVPDPAISFQITPDSPCPAPVHAVLTAFVPSGSTVVWYLGDSSTASGASVAHTYTQNRIDTILFVVTDPAGCKDTLTREYEIAPFPYFIQRPDFFYRGGCVPLTRTFGLAPVLRPYIYTPIRFYWDFGDGSPVDSTISVAYSPVHTYTAVGKYRVTLMSVTPNGCVFYDYDSVFVGTRPNVTFTATPLRQCFNNNKVLFTRTLLSGSADAYYWLFGDGAAGYTLYDTVSSPVFTVSYHYQLPGIFDDTLIAFNNFCADTFIRPHYDTIDSPRAAIKPEVICTIPFTVHFANISMGADSSWWFFGDGGTSAIFSPTHTFPGPAIYVVMLVVKNRTTGCIDTAVAYVDLIKPVVKITANDTAICKDDFVTMTATPVSGQPLYYRWFNAGTYGDNYTNNYDDKYFVDTFHTPGRYTIKVLVYDQHLCWDTVTKVDFILVAKPEASVYVSPASVCWPQTTTFTDAVTDQPGTFVANRYWTFGDGTNAITLMPVVTHSYTTAGTYPVTEYVTDNVGCMDTVQLTRALYHPQAAFTSDNQHPCADVPVHFTNTSTPFILYAWSFGDGSTSTVFNPTHAYADSGHFTVRLIVTESHGCKDTVTKLSYETVSKPYASFSMSDSVSVCPPFSVHFTNTSTGGATNLWQLGDGDSSVATNPSNLYTLPGYDTVRLIVTDVSGCRDTAVRHVKIYGYAGAFTYLTDSGCSPLPVLFDADLSQVSIASSITWDFADGVISPPSLSDTITHVYLVPGAYVPKLIISDHAGCISSSRGLDTIRVDAVTPGFTAVPDPVCARDTLRLTDTSHSYWSAIVRTVWYYNGTADSVVSPVVIYTMTGVYTDSLVVTDGWGCTANAVRPVTVNALPPVTGADSAVCENDIIALTDSAAGGYWSSSNTAVALIDSVGTVTAVGAGTAVITYSVRPACYTTIALTINPTPDPGTISGPAGVCVGDTIWLRDVVPGGAWSVDNANASVSSAGIVTGIAPGPDTVIYAVVVASCPAQAIKAITVYPLPDSGIISGRDSLCIGDRTLLSETIPDGRWVTGNGGIAQVDPAGNVTGMGLGIVIITYTTPADSNGCTNQAVFPVTVISADFTLNNTVSQATCFNSTDGSISVSVDGGMPPFVYAWSTGDSSSAIGPLAAGTYTVTVTEPDRHCVVTQSVVVTAPDSIRIAADLNLDVCEGPKGGISVIPAGGTEPYTFLWSNAVTGSAVTGLHAGTYTVTVTDANGCHTELTVALIDSSCLGIIIYNAISPNGDGINDTWVIEGLQHYPGSTVRVFDKWGDEVFSKTDYRNDWNGTTGGAAVPDGTYYYLVKLNSVHPPGGKSVFTGSLLIKR